MNDRFELARRGDPDAVELLLRSLRPRLCRMAGYYARRSGEDRDDLLQEALVGLLEALPVLDPTIGAPEQYLIQRARWRLLDALRRSAARRCSALEDEAAELIPSPLSGHEFSQARLAEFMGGLKATQRDVVQCLLAGLTWREAGTVLGCTSANIAYHMRLIRRRYQAWNMESRSL